MGDPGDNPDPIRAIRELNDALERAKDAILAHWEASADLDPAARSMWATDAKEAYYSVISAWTMLESVAGGNADHAGSARSFLEAAAARAEQAASELDGVAGLEAAQLAVAWREAFEACRSAIADQLERLAPRPGPRSGVPAVALSGEDEVAINCAACGHAAASLGLEDFMGKPGLVYHGLTHTAAMDIGDRDEVFGWLLSGDLAAAHAHAKRYRVFEDGLDCYCPECGNTYCRDCVQLREEYDEGFYDCTYGTCPAGHSRIVHD